MPWEVKKKGSQYAVVKKGSGAEVGRHSNSAAAQAQVRALYANYHDGDNKLKKDKSAKGFRLSRAAARRSSNAGKKKQ